MSTARHPQTDGLTERFNETMQILLLFYTNEYGVDWVYYSPVVKFYYNCRVNEASKHASFEVSYEFQPTTPANKLLPLTGAPAHVADRITELASVRDVVRELLYHSLSNEWLLVLSTIPYFCRW